MQLLVHNRSDSTKMRGATIRFIAILNLIIDLSNKLTIVHRYYYLLNNVITMFVVESILSSQFAWVNVFSYSNLSLKHAYMNFPKLSIVCCVSRYVQ